jgi:hypothetical protein
MLLIAWLLCDLEGLKMGLHEVGGVGGGGFIGEETAK